MSRLTRDGTAEFVSRDQVLRRERGQGSIHFPCSAADHEQDWQPYQVDPYDTLAICVTIHVRAYIYILENRQFRTGVFIFRDPFVFPHV